MAEHNRKSLVDDSFDSVGSGKAAKAKSGGGSKNGLKIGLISVCFILAAVLLAYNFGIIPNPFEEPVKPTVVTPEDNKVITDYKKQGDTAKKQPNPPAEGGS